ncbi:proteasome stabiliser-domain-containing protein [Haematococcus lacustris]
MTAQPSAAEEVAGLDKVLLRLGLTEEVDLEKVLARLIPAVVGSLKSPHDATRKKVLEILAHVNKRLKGAAACQLPLTPLLDMFSQPSAAPMVRSFCLVYVEMAVERCPPAQRLPAAMAALVSPLLLGVGSRPAQQSLMCLRLAACCLEGLSSPLSLGPIPGLAATTTATSSGAAGQEQPGGAEARLPGVKAAGGGCSCDPAALAAYPFLGNLVDRQAFLGYALKLLQYGPKPSASRATTALAAAQAVLATAAGNPPPPEEPALPPPGLSAGDVAALKDRAGQLPAGEVLVRRKMGVLNLLAGAGLPGRELLLPCLVAACDSADQVARRGEEMLKRQCSHEGNKPQVDLEADTQLLHALYALFLGTVASEQAGAAVSGGVVAGGALLTDIAGVAAPSTGAQTRPDAIVQPASVPGGAGSARLRLQGTEFAVWVSKHAASHQLKAMAPAILQGLLRTLDTSGSGSGQADPASPAPAPPGTGGGGGGGPAATDATSLTLRGFAYQALGSLATRVPDSLQARMDIAQRFFTALADEPSGLRATVAEAAACLAAAFKSPSPALAEELGELLLTSITSPKDAVRLCAVQWANRLFPFNTVQARWLCVLAAGDSKLEVREEAARGLRLSPATLLPLAPVSAPHAPPPASSSPSASNPTSSGSTAQGRAGAGGAGAAGGAGSSLVPGPHPELEELLAYAHKQAPRLALAAEPGRSLVLQHRAYLALLRFSQSCWRARGQTVRAGAAGNDPEVLPDAKSPPSQAESAAGAASVPAAFLTLLEGGLARDAPADLVVAALQGLVEVAGEAPAACEARFASRLALLRPLTGHVDPAARVAAARVVGVAAAGLEPTAAEQLLTSLTTSLGPHTTQPNGPGASPPTPGAAPASSPPQGVGGQQQQAAGSSGASVKFEMQEGSIMAAEGASAPPASSTPSAPTAMEVEGQGPGREEVAGAVGGEVAGLIARVLDLMGDKDPKVALRAVSAAGLLAWSAAGLTPLTSTSSSSGSEQGSGSGGPPAAAAPGGAAAVAVVLRALQAGLVAKLAASKAEELQFAAGESLAFVFGGVALRPADVLRANFSGLADQLASSGKGGSSLAGGASSGSSVEAAAGPTAPEGREGLQRELLGLLMKDMAVHSRAEVRCAAAVWLVSLLTFCGPQPGLRGALGDIQDALGSLLGDSHELTQEMASRGVSLVYELGDAAQKQKLVEALVGVLQGSGARAAKVKLQADTKVFEEGSIGTAPGGDALSTYQELCSLATELGQPDLVYKFMDLARHNQALNTRRGAAFGFAGIAKLAGEQLQPHVQQLVPKLYRYQYDPNPRVQESMAAVWKGLVDDPKAAVDAAFPAIMADLLKELGGRLWRSRQAAAAAMADLLQGRRWGELQGHLAQVWTMTFRAMDDIKDSRHAGPIFLHLLHPAALKQVRRAAAGLARSLRGVTLRLCDPSLSPPRDAQAAVGLVLPLMLDQGITSSVEEVRGLAMSVVAAAAKQARAEALKPLLPQLVQALLEGLSSLEDTRLNYIEQHANRLGLDAERLDSARTAAAQSSSLADTLELAARVAGSDLEAGGSLEALLPVLAGIVRRGVGLNTKVGTARFIRSVAARAGSALRPHAPTLVKALTSAMRSERSNVVRKAYAAAAGQVCKHAADKRVAKVVGEAAEAYAAEGADSDARYCAGLVVRELLRAAPEVAAGHAAVTLPLAFGAKMDEDKEVAAVWKEVWEEGCASEAGALRLYAQEITALLASGLGSQHWGRKKACAQAITALAQLGGDVVSGEQVGRLGTALVAEASGGRLWEGKEEVVDALGALAKAVPAALGSNVEGGAAALVATALAAAGRKKGSYRWVLHQPPAACKQHRSTTGRVGRRADEQPSRQQWGQWHGWRGVWQAGSSPKHLDLRLDRWRPPSWRLWTHTAPPPPPSTPPPPLLVPQLPRLPLPLPVLLALRRATTASSSSPLPPSVTAAGLDSPPADVGGGKAGRGEGQGGTDSSSAGAAPGSCGGGSGGDVQIQQVRAAALKTLAAAVAVVQHVRSSSVTGATAPVKPGGGDSDLTAARSGADLAPLPDAEREHRFRGLSGEGRVADPRAGQRPGRYGVSGLPVNLDQKKAPRLRARRVTRAATVGGHGAWLHRALGYGDRPPAMRGSCLRARPNFTQSSSCGIAKSAAILLTRNEVRTVLCKLRAWPRVPRPRTQWLPTPSGWHYRRQQRCRVAVPRCQLGGRRSEKGVELNIAHRASRP